MSSEFLGHGMTLLGVAIGSAFTWFITKYQLHSSTEMARKERWNNELVTLLSEFVSKCYALTSSLQVESKGIKEDLKLMEEAGALRMRLFLMLNPNIKQHQDLIDCINATMKCAMQTKKDTERESLSTPVQKLLDVARTFTSPAC